MGVRKRDMGRKGGARVHACQREGRTIHGGRGDNTECVNERGESDMGG
jgi:hypothetical protein